MDRTAVSGPIVVVDEALAQQLVEDGERIIDGLTKVVDALRIVTPPRVAADVASAPAAPSLEASSGRS